MKDSLDQVIELIKTKMKQEDIQAHFSLATLYHKKGDIDSAVEECQKILELDPKYKMAYEKLSIIEMDRGNKTKAVEYWKKILEIDPEDEGAKEMIKNFT